MKRLARTRTGDSLVGDHDGFVPLASLDEGLSTMKKALAQAPAGLPPIDSATANRISASGISFGVPVVRPPQLWGIGLNYQEHAAELDESRPTAPASFLQPPGVVRGPGGPIQLPPESVVSTPTAEAELGVVIGRQCRDIQPNEVQKVIAGYIVAIDVTAEDIIRQNPRFLTRAKQFDSFLILGAEIHCPEGAEIEIGSWAIQTIRNQEIIAEANVAAAQFSPAEIVSSLSQATTLDPGTIIITGTPGAVPIKPGDSVSANIDAIGSVTARVTR